MESSNARAAIASAKHHRHRARHIYAGNTGTLALSVLNVNTDDLPGYLGDGIDDAWQVQYFGLNNPQAAPTVDADGTGQTNFFKHIAGLNPLDPNSRFSLSQHSRAEGI